MDSCTVQSGERRSWAVSLRMRLAANRDGRPSLGRGSRAVAIADGCDRSERVAEVREEVVGFIKKYSNDSAPGTENPTCFIAIDFAIAQRMNNLTHRGIN